MATPLLVELATRASLRLFSVVLWSSLVIFSASAMARERALTSSHAMTAASRLMARPQPTIAAIIQPPITVPNPGRELTIRDHWRPYIDRGTRAWKRQPA